MNAYEYYAERQQFCLEMAAIYRNDAHLFTFYRNAAAGFGIKKNALTLAEARK